MQQEHGGAGKHRAGALVPACQGFEEVGFRVLGGDLRFQAAVGSESRGHGQWLVIQTDAFTEAHDST